MATLVYNLAGIVGSSSVIMKQLGSIRLKRMMLLIVSLMAFSLSSAEKITLVADDWCPYNCEPKSKSPGYVIELLERIYSPHGMEVVYQYLSWSDSVEGVLSGEYDGAIGATPAEVEQGIFPNEEIGVSVDVFVTRKDSSWQYTGVPSLPQVKVGATMDYDYGNQINQYIRSANDRDVKLLSSNNASELNLTRLYRGRIDTYIGNQNVIFYKANALGLSNEFKIAGSIRNKEPVYIVFSPKNQRSIVYAQILSQGMSDLRKSGELKRIMGRYGLKDWK